MTVGDCAQSLLAVAAILSGPRFDAACAVLEGVLVGPKGYAQSTTWSLQGVDTMQGMPAMPGAENLLVSEREHIDVHIAHAITLSSPLASDVRRARPDLIAAVEYVVGLRYPEQIAAARTATSRALDVAEALLAPEDAALRALTSPAAARLLQDGSSMALTAACAKVMGWTDATFVHDMCKGFPAHGKYPDTGIFRAKTTKATKNFCDLEFKKHKAKVVQRLQSRGLSKSKTTQWHLAEITRKTDLEVAKGLSDGPWRTDAEVDAALRKLNPSHTDGCWQVLSTFAVEQGFTADGNPKCRRCDNAKDSCTNECLETGEQISCEEASFPALAAMLFSDAFQGPLSEMPMCLCTDDVDSAYRRLACRHPEASVVAVWHTGLERVVFYTMPGHNFGLAAAVLSFNR